MQLRVATTIAFALLLTGCARYSGGIAPSNIPLEAGSYAELGEVKGQDCTYYLFGIIPISGSNHTRAAMDVALGIYPEATALVDITSDTFSQHFVVFSRGCIRVEGTAVRRR